MGSKTSNKEAEGRLKIGVEEAAQTVGAVVTEVTDGLRLCGVKGSVVEKVCDDQVGLVNGVPEGVASLKALYPSGKFVVAGALKTCIGSVEMGISPLVATDSSVLSGTNHPCQMKKVGPTHEEKYGPKKGHRPQKIPM